MMRILIALVIACLLGCGSADNDPAQRVEKPVPVTATKE